jgi:hypothetical protein
MSTGDSPDLDLIAASLRASHGDLDAFTAALAGKLEQALPGRVQVERRRSGMFGPKAITRITVNAGDSRLMLNRTGATVETLRARVSGGIVLKTEPLPADNWFRELSGALASEAEHNEVTRQAIERLLTG